MSRDPRPRFDEDLFEVLNEEKENPNQGIDDVLTEMFPELKDMVNDKKKDRETLF